MAFGIALLTGSACNPRSFVPPNDQKVETDPKQRTGINHIPRESWNDHGIHEGTPEEKERDKRASG